MAFIKRTKVEKTTLLDQEDKERIEKGLAKIGKRKIADLSDRERDSVLSRGKDDSSSK